MRLRKGRPHRFAEQGSRHATEANDRAGTVPGGTREAVVFVVDDDDSVRKALSRLIRSVGHDVESFPSAAAFLDHTPSDRPACLVLDVRMPWQSGLHLQETLKQAAREMPSIFLTGHGDVPMSVRAMKAGAVDFLQKPGNDRALLDTIQRALPRWRPSSSPARRCFTPTARAAR